MAVLQQQHALEQSRTASNILHFCGCKFYTRSRDRAVTLHSDIIYIVLITRARVEYGRIFHEQYFHEPKARVNIRVKYPAILHDDKCNKLFILT